MEALSNRSKIETWSIILFIAVPGFATIKAAAIVAFFFYGAIKKGLSPFGILIFLGSLTLIICWHLLGRFNGVSQSANVDQSARLAIFFMLFACGYFCRDCFSTCAAIDRVCLATASVAAASKAIILIAVIGFGLTLDQVQTTLGFETVTASIGFGLERLQFPTDYIIAFLVACYVGGQSRKKDAAFIVAVAVVVFFSFSRFLFFSFFCSILVRSIWIRRFDFMPKVMLVATIAVALPFFQSLTDRFTGEGSTNSDETRIEQIAELTGQIQLAPYFGYGLGASVPGYLRSQTLPYSYEVQWYALVMQVGLVGVSWLLATILLMVLSSASDRRAAVCMSLILVLWALAGFTNPSLTSLGSGVGMALLIWRSSASVQRDFGRQFHFFQKRPVKSGRRRSTNRLNTHLSRMAESAGT